ncbi:MAG: thiamine pyrophosphate-dependent dehydrogenase E1 component subunit alpha [Actinomycetota bacterium]|nr:thiamine pyrophosphate-dependent dehydrogenase E1 component subunit alpha [Actinomycetota bacterium]
MEKLDKGELLELYRKMVLIRRFEEKASELRQAGFIPGFLHPYIGQEAVATGACAALEDSDVITSTHRGHGHMLARGADPRRMYAELYARKGGYNRAKGGSLHMIDTELGFLGANGIVGGGIPLATGAALQLKRTGSTGVAVSFFGDGATNQGSFHESLNLASLWKLPVIFVCENNLYGEFTPQDKHQPIRDIARRADSYAMTGEIADGNDVLDMLRVASEAVNRARAGAGPSLVEAKTYRHRGHYEGDMGRYRSAQEVEEWMAKDPILNLETGLLQDSRVAQEELDEVRNSLEEELDAAAEFAAASPHPQPGEALEDVFAAPDGVTST